MTLTCPLPGEEWTSWPNNRLYFKISCMGSSDISYHDELQWRYWVGERRWFYTEEPLNTKFLLVFGNQEKPCPSFYGKVEDKKKGYRALKEDIHPEVHSNRAHFQCYWKFIPKIRLSKTAKYLNKVFLSCGWISLQVLSVDSHTVVSIAMWSNTRMAPKRRLQTQTSQILQ